MDTDNTRLRQLGYHQDLEGRWVHPDLSAWLLDPVLLLETEPAQVDAFHDPATWADIREPARPLMEADLARAVNQAELIWNGWLGHWQSPSGLQLPQPDLERLGGEALSALEQQRLAWLAEHSRRRLAGCAGMGAMILWLGVGWAIAGSVTVWLLGMAVIAVGSWLLRPVPWPQGLDPDPPDNEHRMVAGREALGPAWHAVALLTAPVRWDSDHVVLLTLERVIAVEHLHDTFTPEVFLRILHALEPIDESAPQEPG